jgi:hypothetical protein
MVLEMRTVDPDSIDRVAKLLVDAGDVASFAEAEALLRVYRMQVVLDAHACTDAACQAAALSAVNTGVRAMHGGVKVFLAEERECVVPFGRGQPLSTVIASVGGELADRPEPDVATIAFGEHEPRGGKAPVLWCVPYGWIASVSPTPPTASAAAEIPAAVLSGSLAVSEIFQWLRGYAVAGDRALEVSLWNPGRDGGGADGPPITHLPAALWLLGLGHLGQAYAWLLSLLPYPIEGARPLFLQDDDKVSAANRATSMLHGDSGLGVRKTRVVAKVMDELGWETTLIERRYRGGPLHTAGAPPVLLGGVDNLEARRSLDDSAFPVIYDAGLGAGPDGFLAMSIRRLPASRPSREIWPTARPRAQRALDGAYAKLEAQSGDRCGVEMLASRTVATSFVGVAAACLVIGGLLRELHGGEALELVDLSLRDPQRITLLGAKDPPALRVASVPCAA